MKRNAEQRFEKLKWLIEKAKNQYPRFSSDERMNRNIEKRGGGSIGELSLIKRREQIDHRIEKLELALKEYF